MVSTFTANVGLEEPARGDYVGTWDLPVNGNTTLLDLLIGGNAAVTIGSTSVTLTSAQFQSKTITLSGVLAGHTTVTFPSSVQKSYEIYNTCTNSSLYTVLLQNSGGTNKVCAPPFEIIDVVTTGSNFFYKGMARIGQLWEHGGSSVPGWVSNCTVPPFINCDGSGFSAVTYPMLATYLGGTTLPDLRGVAKATLNQGTGRLTSSAGVDGNTNFSIGGSQGTVLLSSNLPPYTPAGTVGTNITNGSNIWKTGTSFNVQGGVGFSFDSVNLTPTSTFAGGAQGGASVPFSRVQPTTVCGITMIRAG